MGVKSCFRNEESEDSSHTVMYIHSTSRVWTCLTPGLTALSPDLWLSNFTATPSPKYLKAGSLLAISWAFAPESGVGWDSEGISGLWELLEGPAAQSSSGRVRA